MKVVRFKIDSVKISDKEFNTLSFGRQMEYFGEIKRFQETSKSIHINQKRRTHASAINEFKSLYNPKEYFYQCNDGKLIRDDSFEIFYKD